MKISKLTKDSRNELNRFIIEDDFGISKEKLYKSLKDENIVDNYLVPEYIEDISISTKDGYKEIRYIDNMGSWTYFDFATMSFKCNNNAHKLIGFISLQDKVEHIISEYELENFTDFLLKEKK